MKRGRPLKRTSLARGTKGLAPGKPLERRTPLKQGEKGLKRTALSSSSVRVRARSWSKQDTEAHDAWVEKVMRGRCVRCALEGRAEDLHWKHDPHHVVPARYLRRYVRALRLSADEAKGLLRTLLWSPRNGVNLCRACHANHETAFDPLPRALIPKGAWEFAEEIGLSHVLERLYPA